MFRKRNRRRSRRSDSSTGCKCRNVLQERVSLQRGTKFERVAIDQVGLSMKKDPVGPDLRR